ncbi:nucleoside hydrolase [Olivibacter sp. SDN3]|uniref:nucleoside hydrolase n=1 Tax=Olivibacter sp. SDN3 TaxID=2764720 RepID=UPI001650FA18|nr:nucleoside hydrolase [Olivibacter sp. SDN3]QNL49037.1 nucleoside hydrolase [Olivibacter sp. SDN3]
MMGTINAHSQQSKQTIIFDTDIGNDIDDVLAMAMLYNYQKQEQVDLKAITISKANPVTVDYIHMLNTYYGLRDIAIGYIGETGPTPDSGLYMQQTLAYEENGKRLFLSTPERYKQVPEAYKLQRKVLAAAPDHSVTLIVVGFSTNMAKLLSSRPDEFSSLEGKELIQKKVISMYMMAGMFGKKPFPEYNVVKDVQAAQQVFKNWPTRIVVSGWEIGNALKFPADKLLSAFPQYWHHPIVNSYFHYMKMPYNRETWDLTVVLQAIEPHQNYFGSSISGTIMIDDDGMTRFSPTKGKHQILLLNPDHRERILNRLVETVTDK